MTRFTDEIKINVLKEKVWAKIADIGAIQDYHPGVTKSYYTSEQREGVGSSRHCDLVPFGSLEEKIVGWTDGESYIIDIHDGQKVPPFKTARAYMSVEQAGDAAIAHLTFEYELKFGPLGWLMDRIMVRRQFKKIVPAMLGGLKRYLENGDHVTGSSERKEHARV